ncbi:beta-glucosidase [Geosmithia morbida]|uniref:beta-glucosidase n=1 Tax=Geosmithia morbida TaxID=1094350 RepID=A0A9P5D2G0_9HYPO|nr:beta-glucosidase [Geosmithia morbida]KAF4125013.1 beta-glucosidase [Geosmithia morbida]
MAYSVNLPDILSRLTLQEKISLLAGADLWRTVPIPEKGVPSVKTSDGPNGARGDSFTGGTTAACFPAACCMASTFDVTLARRVGTALAEETHSKGARCLLAPTMCTQRHPLGGRNFESFSEDPFLAGKMAAQVVKGVQDIGVAATIKHFAANEQETERLTVNETVSERALREIYLKPFEISVKEARPWAVMTAYNMVNGHHADSNEFLLKDVLRGDWGWDGLIMSDWGGTNSTGASLNAGLDLEMPGPTRWRTQEAVLAAIKSGEVSEKTIDERAMRVLEFLKRLKCFEDPSMPPEQAINRPEHQALIREAGSKGIVLLKNDDAILPLSKDKVRGKKIALLGHAKTGMAHGGGSASVNAHYRITPWDALNEALGPDVEFTYSKEEASMANVKEIPGAHTFRMMPSISENVVDLTGGKGWTRKFYEQGSTVPVDVSHGHEDCDINVLGFGVRNKDATIEGTYTAPETATYYFTCSGLGPSQLIINDKLVSEQKKNCEDAMGFLFGGTATPEVKVPLEAGKEYKIVVRTRPAVKEGDQGFGILQGRIGVRIGHMSATEYDKDLLSEAVDAAKAADVAVVFVGHETAWETEGQDQVSFNLPKDGSQDRLISAVAKANPNTIVVNHTGVAIAMPWLGEIKGLLQAWFPGQEVGNSVADVLTGRQNPEGHLTCTFPKFLEDSPAHDNFPGKHDANGRLQVTYEEGIFVGYRHFDRLPADKVNFPFGYGLSYTTFGLSDLSVEESDGSYTVNVKLSNTGKVAGATAVQIYVGAADKPSDDPVKVLAAFAKVHVEPGESKTVSLPVTVREFASFDEASRKWVIKGGDYNFMAGKSAGEIVQETKVAVKAQSFDP